MTTRSELLHSSIRLLLQDQKRVTDAFADWTANENVQRHESVRPVMTSVLRHLQRDLDRMYVLMQSYASAAALERSAPAEDGRPNSTAEPVVFSGDGEESPAPSLAEILPRGYQALDELSTRYASVYCVATALAEPSIANVARSNLEGLRSRLSEFIGVWPLVMVHTVATKHPTFPVNRSVGPRVQALLQNLWSPTTPGSGGEQR